MSLLKYPLITALFAIGIAITFSSVEASSLGDEWNSIKSSLSAGEKAEDLGDALAHVGDAKSTYENSFQPAAIELDSESHQIIEQAFARIEASHAAGNVAQAKLERQAVDKTIYTIAYLKVEQALDNSDSESFGAWIAVLEKKFTLSEKHPELHQMITKMSADSSEIPEYSESLKEGLLGIFKLKTLEEPEEAIFALNEGDIPGAQKFAYEGLYYYRTLHPAIEERLGPESADHLLHELEEVIEITMSDKSAEEMKEDIEHVLDEITLIIREYEGGDSSEIGLALAGIKDRLHLVEIEYLDAVNDGRVVNQVEYDETVLFLAKATEILNEQRESLMKLSESDTAELDRHLMDVDAIVSSVGSASEVSILVGKGLDNVASLESFAGGATEVDILEYFDEIDRLLNEAKSDYRNGQTQMAFDKASIAYLDNYEFVEGPLGGANMELMLKIETDMREDLRNMIKNGASAEEVDAQVDMILADLAEAKQVIPEFGTIATMILAAALVSTIALSAKFRLSLVPKM